MGRVDASRIPAGGSMPYSDKVRRIKVSTETVVRSGSSQAHVRIIGISTRDALLFAREPFADFRAAIELLVPVVGGRDLPVTAALSRVDKVADGIVALAEFESADERDRAELSGLMRILLSGSGGGGRRHPRVVYDVPCHYGASGEGVAHLDDISLGGMSLRLGERLEPGTPIQIAVPDYSTYATHSFAARVVQQRVASEGVYHTGVALAPLAPEQREKLARLLVDLLCQEAANDDRSRAEAGK